jgi:hypothetical protein
MLIFRSSSGVEVIAHYDISGPAEFNVLVEHITLHLRAP